MLVLSFDIGFKYIGVAIGNNLIKKSIPLTTIKKNIKFVYIFNIIDFWIPDIILIGYPINNKFNNKKLLDYINKFILKIKIKFTIPVYLVNENLSTWRIKNTNFIKKVKFKKKILIINALSASIIIDQWFLTKNKNNLREN